MYTLKNVWKKKIALVDLLTEKNVLFSNLLDKSIKKYNQAGKKILFITNKKWYSSSNICKDCWFVQKCKNCDIPIAKYVYNDKFIYLCPICKQIYENNNVCKNCNSTNIINSWIWTYKLAEILKENYGLNSLILENSDLNSNNKLNKAKEKLNSYKFIISTSVLSIQFSGFVPDLIVFFNADIWLSIPDFNIAEKHFLFLYEFIKSYSTNNFIIQTFNKEHYVYKNILDLDLDWFWKDELKYRKVLEYPPYNEMAIILYKNQIEEKLYRKISKLESELKYLIQINNFNINLFPTPQLIYKKFWKYHYNIILKWQHLKDFLDIVDKKLKIKQKWFQIDRMPSNII